MASGYYGGGYHRSGFYDSGYYGEETEEVVILPSPAGGASGPRQDREPRRDDETVIMAVIKQFLIEVNRDL